MDLSGLDYVERDGKKYDIVYVRNSESKPWERRIHLINNLCVALGDEKLFKHPHHTFRTTTWKFIQPLPQKKYVQFTVEDDLIGKVVVYKSGTRCMIIGQDDENVAINGTWYSYDFLFSNFCNADGTPCGKEVEE